MLLIILVIYCVTLRIHFDWWLWWIFYPAYRVLYKKLCELTHTYPKSDWMKLNRNEIEGYMNVDLIQIFNSKCIKQNQQPKKKNIKKSRINRNGFYSSIYLSIFILSDQFYCIYSVYGCPNRQCLIWWLTLQ